MRNNRYVYQSSLGGPNKLLKNVCGNFQGILLDPRLPGSRYIASDGGVNPSASPCRGNRHGWHRLSIWRESDAAANLTGGIRLCGGLSSTQTTMRYLWSSKWSPFRISHLGTRTSKRKTCWGTKIGTQARCLIRAFNYHEGGFHWEHIPRRYREIPKRGR